MNTKLYAAMILSAMLGSHAALAQEKSASAKAPEHEKCYGVAKAGKNDCSAKDGSNACAGLAKKDGNVNDWVYVPKGLCEKLAGGVKG